MGRGKAVGEALLRLLLFCGSMALVRAATQTFVDWEAEVASAFRLTWGGWVQWIALMVAAGFVAGLACLPGRPARYRVLVPLVVALPALLMLAHYLVVAEAAMSETDIWILDDHSFFYMQTTVQVPLAAIAGFGIALGLQPRRGSGRDDESPAAAEPPAEDGSGTPTAP
ncbi:MAG TPA: hypothetical protein VHL78_10630 [Actinomycetota bacterium]|nr:hypothetical protein [Actinomycetota bacterium]